MNNEETAALTPADMAHPLSPADAGIAAAIRDDRESDPEWADVTFRARAVSWAEVAS